MLTGNALIMKPGICSVNTLQLTADQHIVGENNFFLEHSQKGVAWEIGHFCLLCIEAATCGRHKFCIVAAYWHEIGFVTAYTQLFWVGIVCTPEAFGCLQWEMPKSDLTVFRFSAFRYGWFQGMYLSQPPTSCAVRVHRTYREVTGLAQIDTSKLEEYSMEWG